MAQIKPGHVPDSSIVDDRASPVPSSFANLTSVSDQLDADRVDLTRHPPPLDLRDNTMDMAAVQRALQATSAAIRDLDSFLSNSPKLDHNKTHS